MAKTRSELREKCMIILYQWDLFKANKDNTPIDEIISNNIEIENDFVKDIVASVNLVFSPNFKNCFTFLYDSQITAL